MSTPKLPQDPEALRRLARRVFEQFKRQSREREELRRRRQAEVAETRAYLESVTVEGRALDPEEDRVVGNRTLLDEYPVLNSWLAIN